jgi:acylaminoacyl-peptidase
MRTTLGLRSWVVLLLLVSAVPVVAGPAEDRFRPMDVFGLEYASDPQVSPDGKQVVYVRNFMDVTKDKRRSNLWIVNTVGSEGHRALTTGKQSDHSPRWSRDGQRLVYISDADGKPQLWCRWMDTGQTAKLTDVASPPSNPAWSPDGKQIAFCMFVPDPVKPFFEMPAKPEGAEWAPDFKVIRETTYRWDGQGYLKAGRTHLFVVSAEGGAARQLTDGPYDHRSPPVWTNDNKALIFSANRHADADLDPLDTDIHELTLADRKVRTLTERKGPDDEPALSPDGQQIAFVGFDNARKGYQARRLYVMHRDGTGIKRLAELLDRDIVHPVWSKDGSGIFFQYDEHGDTRLDLVGLKGEYTVRAAHVGGVEIGRPYASGSFSVSDNHVLAFPQSRPDRPADVAVLLSRDREPRRLTALNENLLGARTLGEVEEFFYESSHDKHQIQGWIVKPPHFDPKQKYPLILEIHGGPYANYGPRFSVEMQLYAAAGYVVVYVNPRGSTGYGEAFAQLINHNYPSQDYDDLMSAVDAVVKRGWIDERNLFVTGGSGGGVLSAWIVGKTNRFRAAVVCKPIVNWYSAALTTDFYPQLTGSWFPAPPWEKPEEYLKRSPLALVGNVSTPTMLMTGEEDHRTPITESEQFYQALKLRKVDTALVRVPGSSHDIGARPSQMIAKVGCILKWFETHRHEKSPAAP